MAIAAPLFESHSIVKLREQELEVARTIQGVMIPFRPLRARTVTIWHEFPPAGGGIISLLFAYGLDHGNVHRRRFREGDAHSE